MKDSLRFKIIIMLTTILFANCTKKENKSFTEVIANGKNWQVTETKINIADKSVISKKITRTFQIKFHLDNTATMFQNTWNITKHNWFENGQILVFNIDNSIISREFKIADKSNESNQIWTIEPYIGTTTVNTNLEWNLKN